MEQTGRLLLLSKAYGCFKNEVKENVGDPGANRLVLVAQKRGRADGRQGVAVCQEKARGF